MVSMCAVVDCLVTGGGHSVCSESVRGKDVQAQSLGHNTEVAEGTGRNTAVWTPVEISAMFCFFCCFFFPSPHPTSGVWTRCTPAGQFGNDMRLVGRDS